MICKGHSNASYSILNVLNYWFLHPYGILEFIDPNVMLLMLSLLQCWCWSLSEHSSFRGLWLHSRNSPWALAAHWTPGLFLGALHTLHSKLNVFFILETRNFCILVIIGFCWNTMSIFKNYFVSLGKNTICWYS